MARPTIFSEELADAICERLAAVESLIRICGGDDFPSDGTVYRWIATIPAFRDKYAQARSVQAERMADEILDIADDGRNDKWTDSEGVVRVDNDVIARSRLRVDARKWLMSKMLPKKYGDRVAQEISGPDGGPLQVDKVERVIVRGNAAD